MRPSLVLVVLILSGCTVAPVILPTAPVPTGEPVLPDLVPVPPVDLHTGIDELTGQELVYFTSVLANVGAGDLVLSAEREGGLLGGGVDGAEWFVSQSIIYDQEGAETRPVAASMVWGGDGHNHWHVEDIARYWLQALGASNEPIDEFAPRYDFKIGFCFFDSHAYQSDRPDRPPEPVYRSSTCGDEGDRAISMGLSVGWSDTYAWTLVGQEIEVTGLESGRYRIWAEADPQRWFVESSAENNVTWVDVDLSRRAVDGLPVVEVIDVGPQPTDTIS
jgi:hypothetical protein